MQESILLASLAAFVLGLGKAGFKGVGPVVAVLLALAFGARNAAGMFVPLMLVGDLIAIYHYRSSIQRKYLWQFLPWVLIGLFIAAVIGKDIPETVFKPVLASLITLSLGLLLLKNRPWIQQQLQRKWFAVMMGVGAGFSSMIGNFAGAFGSIYFLSTGIPKKELIGTTTLVFFIGNLCKLPLHIFIWKTLAINNLALNLQLLPILGIGFVVGIRLINIISEQHYRRFLLIAAVVGVIFILIA